METKSSSSKISCLNCGFESAELLNGVDSAQELVPNSDGQFMTDMTAERRLCGRCACMSIRYLPEDRLLKYFDAEYDISDSVQNNLIVKSNQVLGKHSQIEENLLSQLGSLGKSANVLEIACGQGHLTERLANGHPDWKVTGLDPSKNSALAHSKTKNVEFICDFFDRKKFSAASFDLVVAHGILNRTPTLKTLFEVSELLKDGGLASFEVVIQESSFYSPFIWDHSFTYRGDTYRKYLAHTGFEIVKEFDCVTTRQFLCRKVHAPQAISTIELTAREVEETRSRFFADLEAVRDAAKRASEILVTPQSKIGLFGAGLYSCVLLHLIDRKKVDFIVDEVKYGRKLLGIPVVTMAEAAKSVGQILLFSRREYLDVMEKKARDAGLKCARLL